MFGGISKSEIPKTEGYNMMNRTRRYIASFFLTAALAGPVSMMAAPSPQAGVQVRIYDRNHKDYHYWNDHENHLWVHFLVINHRRHHEFASASRREQAEYWNWRHAHPDRG
jgi:hypothetical protein